MLSAFLTNDALLWGCIAMAMIALVTVGRVASRRRRAGKTSRRVRAEAAAVHEFLEILRAEHAANRSHPHGIWHYDFATGTQRFSDGFGDLLGVKEAQTASSLKQAGVDMARLARENFEETEPYEVQFALDSSDVTRPRMVLKACNLRDANGKVKRCVAMLSEAPISDID